jgi:hypothetical protein
MAIYVSTSDAKQKYEVPDAIFALDSHKEGFFSNVDPNKAFEGVKKQLTDKCAKLGGDAVVSCQFEYRELLEKA